MTYDLNDTLNDPLEQIRVRFLELGCPLELLPSDAHITSKVIELVLSEFWSRRQLDLWIERYTIVVGPETENDHD